MKRQRRGTNVQSGTTVLAVLMSLFHAPLELTENLKEAPKLKIAMLVHLGPTSPLKHLRIALSVVVGPHLTVTNHNALAWAPSEHGR